MQNMLIGVRVFLTVKKYTYEILGENFSTCEIVKTKKSCGHPDFLSDEIF